MICNDQKLGHFSSAVLVFVPTDIISSTIVNAPDSWMTHRYLSGVDDMINCKSFSRRQVELSLLPLLFKREILFPSQFCARWNTIGDTERIKYNTSSDISSGTHQVGNAQFSDVISPYERQVWLRRERTRKLMMLLTIPLFNFRTKNVSLNQIQTIFMPFMSVEAQSFILERFNF